MYRVPTTFPAKTRSVEDVPSRNVSTGPLFPICPIRSVHVPASVGGEYRRRRAATDDCRTLLNQPLRPERPVMRCPDTAGKLRRQGRYSARLIRPAACKNDRPSSCASASRGCGALLRLLDYGSGTVFTTMRVASGRRSRACRFRGMLRGSVPRAGISTSCSGCRPAETFPSASSIRATAYDRCHRRTARDELPRRCPCVNPVTSRRRLRIVQPDF